jgi:hypothetical protein
MTPQTQKHRSRLCRMITNLHVANESQLARRDCCGIAVSVALMALLAAGARGLLAAH